MNAYKSLSYNLSSFRTGAQETIKSFPLYLYQKESSTLMELHAVCLLFVIVRERPASHKQVTELVFNQSGAHPSGDNETRTF